MLTYLMCGLVLATFPVIAGYTIELFLILGGWVVEKIKEAMLYRRIRRTF